MAKSLVLNLPLKENFNYVDYGNNLSWSSVDLNSTSKYEYETMFPVEPVIKNTSTLKDFSGNILTESAVYFADKGIRNVYSYFNINPEYFVEDFYNSEISYTVSLWFNSAYNTASSSFSQIYEKYHSDGSNYTSYYTPKRQIISIDQFCDIRIEGNGLYVSGKDGYYLISNYSFTTNIWHHIAICYNAEIKKTFLYFDGEMIASSTDKRDIAYYSTSRTAYIGGTWYANYYINDTEKNYKVHTYNSYVGYISNVQVYIGLARWPDGVIDIEETKTVNKSHEYISKKKNIETGIIRNSILNFPFEKDAKEKDNKVTMYYTSTYGTCNTSNIKDKYGDKPYATTYKLNGGSFKFLELFRDNNSITFKYNISELRYKTLSSDSNESSYNYLILNIMGSYKYNNSSLHLHTVPVINIGYRNGYLYFIFCKNYNIKANNNFRTDSVFYYIRTKYNYPQHDSIGLRIPLKLEDVVDKWCEISISYIHKTNTFNIYIDSLFAGSVQIKDFTLSNYIYYFGIRAALDDCYSDYSDEYKTENNTSVFVKRWEGQYIRDLEINMNKVKYYQIFNKYNEECKYNNSLHLGYNLDDAHKEIWTKIGNPIIKDAPKLESFSPNICSSFEKAAYFNGSSGLLYDIKLLDLFRNDFTFYCWVKNEMTDKNERFILRMLNFLPSVSSYYPSVLEIFYNKSKQDIGIRRAAYYYISPSSMSMSDVKNEFYIHTTDYPYIADNWHNIAFCYTAADRTIYFYLNGNLIGKYSMKSDLQLSSYFIWLGFGLQSSSTYGFIGYMRHVYLESGVAKWTRNTFDIHEILFDTSKNQDLSRTVEWNRKANMCIVGPKLI